MALINNLNANFKQLSEENKVNNGYLTGGISTEKKMFEQVREMKHSTFDLSKFEVVGTPTITEDGVASGFSANNFVKVINQHLDGKHWKFMGCFTTASDVTTGQSVCGLTGGGDYNYILIQSARLRTFLRTTNSTYNFSNTPVGSFVIQPNTKYYYSYEFTGSKYILGISEDNTNWTYGEITDSAELTNITRTEFRFGLIPSYATTLDTYKFLGQIDLKQFSITVDGVEVFNGNKTGIDIIKPDDYEKVNNPVISEDGILTGEVNKQVRVPVTFDATKTYKVSFDATFGNEINGQRGYYATALSRLIHVYNYAPAFVFYYQPASGNPKEVLQITKKPNTTFNIFVEVNLSTLAFNVGYKESTETEYNIKTFTMENPMTPPTQSTIDFGQNLLGDLDLNTCKIYENDILTHQLTLKIPYTQSKTGSKIVDARYRSRVQDVYEQFGQANYFTLLDGEKYNAQVVGNPTLVGGVASGFSSSNYLIVPEFTIGNSLDLYLRCTYPTNITTSSNAIITGTSYHRGGVQIGISDTTGKTYISLRSTNAEGQDFDIVKLLTIDTLQLGETYDFHLQWTGDKYIFYYKKISDISWTKKDIVDSNLKLLTEGSINVLGIGNGNGYWDLQRPFQGSIDLSQFSIKVDGREVFRGYEKDSFTLPMGELYGMLENKGSYAPPILSSMWSDHILDNASWLRADTFAWHSGDMYVSAYNKLIEEYATGSISYEEVDWKQPVLTSDTTSTPFGNIIVTASSYSSGGGYNYEPYKALDGIKSGTNYATGWGTSNTATGWWQIKFPYKLRITGLKCYERYDTTQANANTIGRFYTSSDMTTPIGDEYNDTSSTAWNMKEITGIPAEGIITDTIYFNKTGGGNYGGLGELEITATRLLSDMAFKRTAKGFKIVDSNQEQAVVDKYNADGIAWYYILDTTNKRFKLPRTKFGFEGLRNSVGGDIPAGAPNITGWWKNDSIDPGLNTITGYGDACTTSTARTWNLSSGSGFNALQTVQLDASRSSKIYQDDCETIQPPATQMYLYFFAGESIQDANIVNVGKITEELSTKVDEKDLAECQVVIDTFVDEENGYRVWSDGYCEQWGYSVADETPTMLFKPYRDTNYNLQLTAYSPSDLVVGCSYRSKNTDRFVIDRPSSSTGAQWKTCGYLTEGEY